MGRGVIVSIDMQAFTQTNTTDYVLLGTSLTIWRGKSTRIENKLLDILTDYQSQDVAFTSENKTITIARFNSAWRDGQSSLYYPFVRERDEWVSWTEQHPELSDYVWPRFLQLINLGDQSRAWMLLIHTKQAETTAELIRKLDSDPEMQDNG